MLILSLYGDPGSNIRPVLLWRKRQLDSVIIRFINTLWHTVWLEAIKRKKKNPKSMSCAAAFAEMPHPSHGRKVFLSTDYTVALRGHFAGLTEGGSDAVAFAVDEASHLRQVTVPPGDVIDRGGLRNEGVVGLHHPLNPVLDRLHQ